MKHTYTVRFAHLHLPDSLKVGDFVGRGSVLGIMGNTGQSTGAHLHIDVTQGRNAKAFRLSDITAGSFKPDFRQLAYFIDQELGHGPFKITTYPYDYHYIIDGKWKEHPGYDLVILTTSRTIFWNRSMSGRVIKAGYDSGYGNHLYIAFKA
jgi:murein DD-endopeptidase MepM/ murein hydrolase activator NlpD